MGGGASAANAMLLEASPPKFVAMGAGGLITDKELQKIISAGEDYNEIKKNAWEFSVAHKAIQRTIHKKESYSAMNNLRSTSNDTGIDHKGKKNIRKHGGDELDSNFNLADRHEKRLGHHKKILSSASMKTSELVSIELLSMRQLSFTMSNQAVLNRTRAHLIRRSASLPKIDTQQDGPNESETPSPGTPMSKEVFELDYENDFKPTKPMNNLMTAVATSPIVAVPVPVPVADSKDKDKEKSKVSKRPKPMLSLQLSDADSALQSGLLPPQTGKPGIQSSQSAGGSKEISPVGNLHTVGSNSSIRLSPHGTLHVGKLRIMENGIFASQDERSTISSSSSKSFTFSNERTNSGRFKQLLTSEMGGDKNEAITSTTTMTTTTTNGTTTSANSSGGSSSNAQYNPPKKSQRKSDPLSATFGGKSDFIEIGTLGSGASGVVSEAVHVPTLTIVALKMLPVYNQEKRQHVSRELAVLYKNLAVLQLVDDSLTTSSLSSDGNSRSRSRDEKDGPEQTTKCENILSLYNAFVDPKSGMINLVIEYMDGGSLEDLVKQGGCKDERVLADIAYQTVKGLCFLHKNNSVHRDIKPANILCSSSGIIKIADFGISRALDKTSAFTNSFVGTVCYMSPERIAGENYSFPCDIWSLGLTLLAVSLGRFPLLTRRSGGLVPKDGTDEKVEIGGGAGGYWAMIKAICDDAPPTPGPEFSPLFHEFIAYCLQKDPDDRLTAQQLLQTTFIRLNIDPDSLTDSDKMKYNISDSPDVTEESNSMKISGSSHQSDSVDYSAADVTAKVRSDSKDEKDGAFSTLKSAYLHSGGANIPRLDIPVSTPTRKGNQVTTPESSPACSTPNSRGNRISHALTARSATAAALRKEFVSPNGIRNSDVPIEVQRRNSKDSEVGILKQLLTGVSSSSKGEHSGSAVVKVDTSGKETAFNELVESGLLNDGTNYDEDEEHELHIMNAIRLEHFDRVLEKIATKLTAQRKNSMLKRQQSPGHTLGRNDFHEDTESDSNDEEDYNVNGHYLNKKAILNSGTADSMDDYGDLTIQSFSFGDESVGEYHEVELVNTNIDSEMDRLLMYETTQQSESKSGSSSSSKHIVTEEHALSQNPIELLRSTNAMSQQSILKGGSYFTDAKSVAVANDQEEMTAVAAAIEQMNLQIPIDRDNTTNNHNNHYHHKSLQQQTPLKLSFSSSKTSSSRTGADGNIGGPNSRSVHFVDPDQQNLSLRSNKDSFRSVSTSSKLPPISGSGPKVKNLKSLQLDLFEDDELIDASASQSRDHHPLTGSSDRSGNFVVLDSKADTPLVHSRKRSFSGSDFIEPQTSTKPTSSTTPEASSRDHPSAINYREMLPKLDGKGLRKWRSLADQLRLPFHLVKLAVKSRLGDMVDLLDADDLG